MASSVVSHKCVANKECKKNGIIKCDGCSSRFCSDHFPVHRRELEARLELLCSDRDSFYHNITQTSKEPIEYLAQIDRWEKKTLAHVKKTADNARHRVRELAITKTSNRELEDFSSELRRRKENEDYFEQDIERLAQQLEQLKVKSKQILKLNISYAPIDWTTIIQINCEEEKQNISRPFFPDTSLLTLEQQHMLNDFCEKRNQQWQLIYRETRDGFGRGNFLRLCADQGPTITLILADGYLFGGYTNRRWKNSRTEIWNKDPTAFLFTLTNPHRILPTKYPIKSSGENAIRSVLGCGPTFGRFDICIHLDSNKNNKSNCSFPRDYCDTTGMKKLTFTGTTNFTTSEIEIYRQA
jgi:hypothetical protein